MKTPSGVMMDLRPLNSTLMVSVLLVLFFQFFDDLIRECFTTAVITDLMQYLYHFSHQFSTLCAVPGYTPCLCDGMVGAPDLVIDFNLTDQSSDIAGEVAFILPVHISMSSTDLSQSSENT